MDVRSSPASCAHDECRGVLRLGLDLPPGNVRKCRQKLFSACPRIETPKARDLGCQPDMPPRDDIKYPRTRSQCIVCPSPQLSAQGFVVRVKRTDNVVLPLGP